MRPHPDNTISYKAADKTESHIPELSQLIESVRTVLQSIAYNLTKNKTDAEDLYQETVFKIIKNQGQYTS